ncbi:hypothetical protein TNCV_2905641 [Trichonephila clavipes]|nr:hypothetical protein TNCV_2905641 [Trichonephila clavipes]
MAEPTSECQGDVCSGECRAARFTWCWAGTHDKPAMIRYPDQWATAALSTVVDQQVLVFLSSLVLPCG